MVDFEITKMNKIHETRNDMCWNFYYIYYGKIYNEEKTRFRRFKYIEWCDIFDLQEYYDKDTITKEEIREYFEYLENSYLTSIKDYNDTEHLKEFYNYCNDTIKSYNEMI